MDMDIAFSGIGYTLGEAPADDNLVAGIGVGRHVPSLKEACLSTLERYIDCIEDIGVTPYYLIETVLRKCNAEQLARIEDHTEDLHESTDELWYLLATNEYKPLRDGSPHYDQSGDWRSNYEAAKQEERERFERVGAKLRQSYSRLDKNRQGRSVIVDPNLRLPSVSVRSSGSGWSGSAPRKPKTLFEKARMEARKITQMYATPIPPRIRNASSGGTIRTVSRSTPRSIPQPTASGTRESRHIIAPSSVFAAPRPQGFMANRNSQGTMDCGLIALTPTQTPSTKARYSYKNRPVVYMSTPRLNLVQKQIEVSSRSPIKPSQASPPISSSAPGAIVDFFKQLNPTPHHTSNNTESSSRSPTSPAVPASDTIKQLRVNDSPPPRSQNKSEKHGSSSQLDRNPAKKVKCNGDYRWLEEDSDDDDKGTSFKPDHLGSLDQTKPKKKAPLSLEEAGRQFFNQLISK
ncbi:hypothetical protein CPB97_002499 [Podila verticillata]|nr:hypothetical protein CPB97_002499 [Podila verticillata]